MGERVEEGGGGECVYRQVGEGESGVGIMGIRGYDALYKVEEEEGET